MENKLLEKVEYLLINSRNVYDITLRVANLAKQKKNIEDLSNSNSKENTIVLATSEIFEKQIYE